MQRAPDKIRFECESCEKSVKLSRMQKWLGKCGHCSGFSWKLTAEYTDVVMETSGVSAVTSLLIGVNIPTPNSYTNETTVGKVPGNVVASLVADKALIGSRVQDYLRLRTQQGLRDRGGRTCRNCGILYIPVKGKSWHLDDCCTKLCAKHCGVEINEALTASEPKKHRAAGIAVTCPQGHEFEALKSFAGCLRPCPDCGTKTQVP